jgi:hypothetical protein
MKISRSVLISVLVILFVIGAIILGVMYRNAYNEKKQAQQMLDLSEIQQVALAKQKAQLEGQLAEAAAEVASWNDKIVLLQLDLEQANLALEQTQNKFPLSAQSIEYSESLISLAEASNVSLRIVTSTETDFAELSTDDFTFYTNVFTVEIYGELGNILDFVDKIATSNLFKTGAITPVTFAIPQPLLQSTKDQMRIDIRTQQLAEIDASIQGVDRIMLIEAAFLELLGEKGDTGEQTLEEMTQRIYDIIQARYNPEIANLLASAIADAINNNLAANLTDIITTIYADAITSLFEDNTSELLPSFTGTDLSDDIIEAIQGIPDQEIWPVIKAVLVEKINSMVAAKIDAMVNENTVDDILAAQITDAEMPSAQLTVAVYSYRGE